MIFKKKLAKREIKRSEERRRRLAAAEASGGVVCADEGSGEGKRGADWEIENTRRGKTGKHFNENLSWWFM